MVLLFRCSCVLIISGIVKHFLIKKNMQNSATSNDACLSIVHSLMCHRYAIFFFIDFSRKESKILFAGKIYLIVFYFGCLLVCVLIFVDKVGKVKVLRKEQ